MKSDALRYRIVPLIVAAPMFLQNLDTSVMATALPTISESLKVPVLDLNLAIASYVISLAVFLPASAWLADRFGPRRIFCAAVLLFSVGSTLCGLAQSLSQLVIFRLLQGAGGAMMTPVARTILLRMIPQDRMLSAMVWFTVPGAIGRMVGPFFGGAIVTVASWHWIFLINVPFGIIGVALAFMLIDKDEPRDPAKDVSIDLVGLAMLGTALLGLLGGLEMTGKHLLPQWVISAMIVTGAIALAMYVRHCRVKENPILDFSVLRLRVFRTAVLGGIPMRVASIGAIPFLLPLLFQIGLGMSPIASGAVTMCIALGGLTTRGALAFAIRKVGFRALMTGAACFVACMFSAYGLFAPGTPLAAICALLYIGGLVTSMTIVTLNTVAYSDMPRERINHATALASMSQQLSIALGVVVGAAAVSFSGYVHHPESTDLVAADFPPVFHGIALLAIVAALIFRSFRAEDGDDIRHRRAKT